MEQGLLQLMTPMTCQSMSTAAATTIIDKWIKCLCIYTDIKVL